MTSLYEIRLYDTDLVNRGLLQGFEYLEFTQRVNAPWNHNIRFKASNASSISTFLRGQDGLVDWIIFVLRTDPVTGLQHIVYEGFNRTVVDQLDSKNNAIFNLYGVGFTELLKRRITIPLAGEEHLTYTGQAETVMKNFVASQAITPIDPNRVIPGLYNEVDSLTGSEVTYSARYTILDTVVNRCAVDGGVDYGIVGGNPLNDIDIGMFEFQVRPIWGLDKTRNNTDGNDAVILDNFVGNMDIPIYSVNSSGEKNVCYVGGQGQGIDREIEKVEYASGLAMSPWNRREDFSDARLESTTAALVTHGQNLVYDNRISRTLTFNVNQTQGCRWGTHWNLGDIITSRYFNNEIDQKIIGITARISALGNIPTEFITAEFEQQV